jgi:hypothetical protein
MKTTFRFFRPLFLLFMTIHTTFAQDYEENVSQWAMSIPSSPAFAVLGVNPEIVQRPSDIKNFKVDWRIKNYNLAPDLALEGQPIWYLFHRKKPISELYRTSSLSKKLSTISLSLATAKIDGVNHASYALKMNLFKEGDPLFNTALQEEVFETYQTSFTAINGRIDALHLLKNDQPELTDSINQTIEQLREEAKSLVESREEALQNALDVSDFYKWNRSMLDVAFARVFTYDNARFDSIKMQSAGFSFWLNGSLGVRDHSMFTAIVRWSRIHSNSNYLLGASYRFGNNRFNFFIEAVYEYLGNFFDPNAENPFAEDEIFFANYETDIGNGWIGFNPEARGKQITVAYGGDFKLSRNILLNFSIRTQFEDRLQLNRLIPVANVVCLMN